MGNCYDCKSGNENYAKLGSGSNTNSIYMTGTQDIGSKFDQNSYTGSQAEETQGGARFTQNYLNPEKESEDNFQVTYMNKEKQEDDSLAYVAIKPGEEESDDEKEQLFGEGGLVERAKTSEIEATQEAQISVTPTVQNQPIEDILTSKGQKPIDLHSNIGPSKENDIRFKFSNR